MCRERHTEQGPECVSSANGNCHRGLHRRPNWAKCIFFCRSLHTEFLSIPLVSHTAYHSRDPSLPRDQDVHSSKARVGGSLPRHRREIPSSPDSARESRGHLQSNRSISTSHHSSSHHPRWLRTCQPRPDGRSPRPPSSQGRQA